MLPFPSRFFANFFQQHKLIDYQLQQLLDNHPIVDLSSGSSGEYNSECMFIVLNSHVSVVIMAN